MTTWYHSGFWNTPEEYATGRAGCSGQELLDPAFYPAGEIPSIPEAATLLKECLEKSLPIYIIGDYDVDGITSTAILTLTIRAMGTEPKTIIPRRFTDGYGISKAMLEEPENALILTVDNGIAAKEALSYAVEKGNKIIILDHHRLDGEVPNADVIVDPYVGTERCSIELPDYCGAGLSLKFAEYLLESGCNALEPWIDTLTVFASFGIVADVMPLLKDNRRILEQGLDIMNHKINSIAPQYCPAGLQFLVGQMEKPITVETLAYTIGPLLNATGRLYDRGATSVLRALLTFDQAKAWDCVQKMVEINGKRKELVSNFSKEAESIARGQGDAPVLLLYVPYMPEGIAGIVAGRISENYRRPTFVFADGHSGKVIKGSGRSYGDFDLFAFATQLKDYTLALGGHPGAVGLSVDPHKMPDLYLAAARLFPSVPPAPEEKVTYDLLLNPNMAAETFDRIKKWAPYGEGIPSPVLALKDFSPMQRGENCFAYMGSDSRHIRFYGNGFEAVGFDMAERYRSLGCPETLNLLGSLEINIYRSEKKLQFYIKKMEAGGTVEFR